MSQTSLKAMQTAVAAEPELLQALQTDPQRGLEQLAAAAENYTKESDPFVYRTIVIVLSSVLIITVLALVATLFMTTLADASVELIVGLGSTALGALAGLLAPSPVRTGG